MTIRDLIEQVPYIQGNVEIQQMNGDEITTLYETYSDNGLTFNDEVEPYLDKEIKYIYSNCYQLMPRNYVSVIVIEVEED